MTAGDPRIVWPCRPVRVREAQQVLAQCCCLAGTEWCTRTLSCVYCTLSIELHLQPKTNKRQRNTEETAYQVHHTPYMYTGTAKRRSTFPPSQQKDHSIIQQFNTYFAALPIGTSSQRIIHNILIILYDCNPALSKRQYSTVPVQQYNAVPGLTSSAHAHRFAGAPSPVNGFACLRLCSAFIFFLVATLPYGSTLLRAIVGKT